MGAPWDVSTWERVRAMFPLEAGLHYFNTGGLGPASAPVLEAMRRQAELQAVHGEHYHGVVESVRETVAAHVGAQADELAFVRNASEGNSIIAGGLDLRRGDEVIFDAHAHPGGSFAWLVRQKHEASGFASLSPTPGVPTVTLSVFFRW